MALENPEQLELLRPKKKPKYRNVSFRGDDGFFWHSKAEYNRYQLLKALESQGHIRNLARQVTYKLVVNTEKICKYVADFVYDERHEGVWINVVEDVKSAPTKTRSYLQKKRLMRALFGISIREVER